ncbi:IMP dehydrogenase [Candidatus Purcelliella pentastirinorum]|uniref:IMP dehydrogenase n=1 Tax=Candidatus Purcelliella pentastirinorum TaxID=472834 RepID=UPI002368CE1F|nr:IMP dehydrogenase [Candidatus Purcelliella pentastirinorum]WDI78839.1 IMP dehydrogenase [Candidatus Purcelliella pentastirinorum]WDR79972.1 IMP dehydrogenase [Candidatus Purcelliella pentastirinorum]
MIKIINEAFTFDDVLIVPAFSEILPVDVNISTKLTNNINLNIPIISAAMDTVTESRLAIALAKEGGIGFIHKNMSIRNQINEVNKVKRYESGIIVDPKVVYPDTTLKEINDLTRANGFAGYPVVRYGTNELIGIITGRDVRFVKDLNSTVSSFMTSKDNLITISKYDTHKEVLELMHRYRIEKILMVDKNFCLTGMITVKDFMKSKKKPYSCKDSTGRLRVGAAVGIDKDSDERVYSLVNAGIDVLLIDSSHAHSKKVLDFISKIRREYIDIDIIAGNVVTSDGALSLLKIGVNAIKVGIGPGSICTTRIVTGVGIPQITAILNVVKVLKDVDIPVISDGGIRFSGDIAKAIVAGASCVMIGSLFAGAEESPGEIEFYEGRAFKVYRGMGSLGAMSKGYSNRYFQDYKSISKLVPEGIEGRVSYKGTLKEILYQQIGGLKSCMGLTGCSTIFELQSNANFVRITNAGMAESHVHDVNITKESPNYRINY